MNATNLIEILKLLIEKYGDQEIVILSDLSILDIEDIVPQDHGSWFALTTKDPEE